MKAVDVVRHLTASLGGLGLGLVLVISIWKAREIPQKERGQRLLPTHVSLIGVSYCLLSIEIARDIESRLGEPLEWPIWLGLPAFLIGDVALLIIAKHLRLRRTGAAPELRRPEDRKEHHP